VKWRSDGTGVHPGGNVGGDRQVTESWSTRYIGEPHDEFGEKLWPVVTMYAYGVTGEDFEGPRFVEIQMELALCRRPNAPGDTEVLSDVLYLRSSSELPSAVVAEAAAKRFVQGYFATYIPWDGIYPPAQAAREWRESFPANVDMHDRGQS
jgi:hypothetical protein